MGYMFDKGLPVLRQGYNIIPILPGQKYPSVGKSWQKIITTEGHVRGWMANGRAEHGIGITTKHTPFVDLDVYDTVILMQLQNEIWSRFGLAPVRIGNAPKRGLLFRTDVPFRKITSHFYIDSEGRDCRVEILCDGQQFVAYHIHPETGRPYNWGRDDGPEFFPAAELPLLTEADGRWIVARFEELAIAAGWTRKAGSTLPATQGGADALEELGLDDGGRGQCGLTDDELRATVLAIPNNSDFESRDEWMKIGFAIHHETDGSDFGADLFYEWSETFERHNDELHNKAWNSFGTNESKDEFRGITARYLLKLAKHFRELKAKQTVDELVMAMGLARDLDELRSVALECKKVDADIVDRIRLTNALQTNARGFGLALGVRDAREMIRYEPDVVQTPQWLAGWVYLKHADQFYNRETGERISKYAFDSAFGRYLGLASTTTGSAFALNIVKIPTYHMTIYLPSEEETFTDTRGLAWINTYSDKELPQVPATLNPVDTHNVQIVERHFDHLFTNRREIDLLKSWLAYIVQTNKRPNWAIILQGATGSGKTFFAQLMARVLGGSHVYTLGTDTLQKSDFTPWAENHQIVFIEELKLHGHNRYDIINKLKPFITNAQIEIHPKRINPYNVPNTTAYLAATNFRDALPLDQNDSRYFVMMSKWQTKAAIDIFNREQPSYYTHLWAAIDQSPGAIRKWLLEYQLSPEFDPNKRAPFSIGHQSMVAEGRSDEENAVEELIEDAKNPLISNDILCVGTLRQCLTDPAGRLIHPYLTTAVGVRRLLASIGFVFIDRFKVSGLRYSVWTRNHVDNPTTVRRLLLERLENAEDPVDDL